MTRDARQETRIQEWQARLEQDPSSLVFVPLADVLLQAGQVEKAASLLEDGLRLRPAHGPALVLLGHIRLEQDRPDEGVRLLQRALATEPENPVVLRLLVAHFQATEAHTHVLPLLDTLRKIEPEEECWVHARQRARAALDTAAPQPEDVAASEAETVEKSVQAKPSRSEVLDRPQPVQEGDGMVTLTLVDIMIQQGYHRKAMAALHRMEEQQPGREDVRERIRQLECSTNAEVLEVPSDLISSPERADERSRQKKQFGRWLKNFQPDEDKPS
ncbi:hypothetical protein CSA17_01005 [bacterium DOLJORAL78_65_58]|nr:MAG: hypothetical protein CSB20_00050 [bacterium DOLZORAL124_64_63]PIE76656.1 MAG: hypothetical protein CSA17_01005 [bacterium DOLJORAL78_65_58]